MRVEAGLNGATGRMWIDDLDLEPVGAASVAPDASLGASAGAASSLDGSLHAILAAAGMQNPLREDRQRPVDPRLGKIEAVGAEASGLFRGGRPRR